jgi:hypothetical protein
MNRWLLSGGAIVSSAMALYSWTHPTAFNLTLLNAQPEQDFKPLPKDMEGVYDRLLTKARSVATQNQFAEAIGAVSGIPKNSRSYGEAQQLQEDWTQELLQRAKGQYKQANARMAIWMLNAIPSTSQRYARATELQQRWAKEWATLRQASDAKKQGDWKGVMSSLAMLKDSVLYQSFPAQDMLQQATSKLYSADETMAQMVAVPTEQPVTVPALPSTAALDAASLPVSAPASDLLIDREQALAWAEPPAIVAESSPVRTRYGGSMSNGVGSSPRSLLAPEFVPLEWAPPTLAPSSVRASQPSADPTSDSASVDSGQLDSSMPTPPSVMPRSQPRLPGSIAPDMWMALPPSDQLSPSIGTSGMKGGSIELQSVPSAPGSMSWSKGAIEKQSRDFKELRALQR